MIGIIFIDKEIIEPGRTLGVIQFYPLILQTLPPPKKNFPYNKHIEEINSSCWWKTVNVILPSYPGINLFNGFKLKEFKNFLHHMGR